MGQLILDSLDLLGHVRIVPRHLLLARIELLGKFDNDAGQLLLARFELFAEARIVADH